MTFLRGKLRHSNFLMFFYYVNLNLLWFCGPYYYFWW